MSIKERVAAILVGSCAGLVIVAAVMALAVAFVKCTG